MIKVLITLLLILPGDPRYYVERDQQAIDHMDNNPKHHPKPRTQSWLDIDNETSCTRAGGIWLKHGTFFDWFYVCEPAGRRLF